jgi:hypothetical protein
MRLYELLENDEVELPRNLQKAGSIRYDLKAADHFDEEFGRRDDNPAVIRGINKFTVDWLMRNQNTTTAYYIKKLPLKPELLRRLEGQAGEHNYIHNPDHKERIDALARDMIENGYNNKSPVMVSVTPDRGAVIYEGNHRIQAAFKAGIERIPVEWVWKGGSEMNMRWHPILFF